MNTEDICNICGSKRFELVKSKLRDDKTKFKVFRCTDCRHVQLLPRPTEDEDKEFYNKNLQDKNRDKEIDYETLRINNLFDTKRHVRLIQMLCTNLDSRILDIGSGYGFFVNELYNSGYKNVTGIEISCERRAMALKHSHVQIIDFDVNNPDRDIGKFDFLTLFHVLEHMADPVDFLKKIKSLLNAAGILICEVPNVREMLLDNCREYNNFYWIRAHLNYFSGEALLDCFRKAGFENVEIKFEQRYGLINLCNWFMTGRPQIEKPIFEIIDIYQPVESFYRQHMESIGRSDAVIAVARV